MTAPLVSVILPTKDRPDRLATALRSVVVQTHPAVECIVVNDGGVDVAEVVARTDSRGIATYLRLPTSRERSAARNAGLAVARGTWIAYLDDDDWFDPRHLATLVAACQREGTAVGYGLARRVVERREEGRYAVERVDHPWQVPFDPVRLLVGNYIPICTLIHRRDCLEQAGGGFDETLDTHEDWELFLRLARHHRFTHVPDVTCAFTWREDGTSTTSAREDDFVRTAETVYRRWSAEAAGILPVAEAHAAFFRTLRRARGERPLRTTLVLPLLQGTAERAAACVTAIAERSDDVEFDVVCVDDATTDATRDLAAALSGDVQVLRQPSPQGLVAAWSRGAVAATGDVLVFLHPDVEPLVGWLRALVDGFEDDPQLAAAGPRLLLPDARVAAAGLVFPREGGPLPYALYRGLAADAGPVTARRARHALPGACLAVRRTAFAAVGGFDAGGLGGHEDADLCLRLGIAGGRIVYEPRSVVVHHEQDGPPDAAGAARFAARWNTPLLADEDVAYVADGLGLRRRADGATATPLPGTVERARWERVAAVQRAAHGAAEAAAALLQDVAVWPEDAAVLGWAARVCDAEGLPQQAAAFRQRAAALAGA